ncbi:MAG: PH domain-containing protein [Planctomycetaceae bacterium]|nr:PH domain-containing protein [Planctomycetaceae bacterium]
MMSNDNAHDVYGSDDQHNGQHRDSGGVPHEQMMDQATDRKAASAQTNATPESLGVSWTGGNYSGKCLRGFCAFVWLVTILFVAAGIYMMVKGKMGNSVAVIWGLLLVVPVCLWVYYFSIYFYRTRTIRYRLTPHRFYNESGLFRKTIDTLELISIEDMRMTQTLTDRLINGGTGSITILSKDITEPTLVISGLENPRDAYESIDEMRRRERSARVIRSVP